MMKFEELFRKRYNSGYFKEGNGEKIIKRCINICTRHRIPIDSSLYASFLKLHPNVRENTLRNRSRCGFKTEDIQIISNIYNTGVVCDDAFTMNVARAIVDGKIDIPPDETDILRELLKSMTGTPGPLNYAKLWILARFGKYQTIISYLKKNKNAISNDPLLARLAAGMYPRFRHSGSNMHSFSIFISDLSAPSATDLFEFHAELLGAGSKLKRIKGIISAINHSHPLGCDYSKFLVLLTALESPGFSTSEKAKIRKIHDRAFSDPTYVSGGWI